MSYLHLNLQPILSYIYVRFDIHFITTSSVVAFFIFYRIRLYQLSSEKEYFLMVVVISLMFLVERVGQIECKFKTRIKLYFKSLPLDNIFPIR